MDNLAKCAFLARQEGISYGQWMAKHKGEAVPEVKLPGKICPYCKNEIALPKGLGKQRRYCSDECRYEYYRLKREERKNAK